MAKIEIFLNVSFDNLKEASWSTERNAKKPQVFAKYSYWQIQEKLQKCQFPQKMHLFGTFLVFLDFLSIGTWQRRAFFVLRSVPQGISFELSKSSFGKKFKFFTIRGDPFDLVGVKLS